MSELRDRELRDLLEQVSALDGDIDVDEHWTAGRRRRTRRGAGIAVLTGVLAIAAAGAVAQTGLLGGAETTTPTGPAAVPDDLETFVFAAGDATGILDETLEPVPPGADDLAGTQWELRGEMWNTTTEATDLTGTAARTTLVFADEAAGGGWGIRIGGCGSANVQSLQLDARGRFVNPAPSPGGQGCADDVQGAQDFWIDSLAGGGQLTLLGDGQWLLLSVETPAPPAPSPTTGPQPTPTTEPDEAEDPTDDDGNAAPGEGAAAPTGEGTVAPTGEGTAAPTGEGTAAPTGEGTAAPTGGGTAAPTGEGTVGPSAGGTAPPATAPGAGAPPVAPPSGEPFLEPGQESVDQPWPGGGGELLAPSLRAGAHDGFDRVVVDLTGAGDLGWRASYTDDPRLDGSGQRSDIAGDSVLELSLAGMAYPEPGSDVYSEGVFGLDTHTLGGVVEVQRTAPFEGMLHVFVGMQGEPRPYRVFLLQNPMRLVIDVQTSA